ncbi:nitrate- and nitrite sensing domain-containing protein [Streptomyces sp. NBC_00210]|uniref:sensor histidine kinase n=1 Tax=unclassified Streptomyces TaxID=2593676 RepID=UPI0032490C16
MPSGRGVVARFVSPRTWRVRWKLAAAVAVPTLLAAVLVVGTISRSLGDASDYARLSGLAQLERPTLELVHALQNERDLTAGHIAGRRTSGGKAVRTQRASADRLVAAYKQASGTIEAPFGTPLQTRLEEVADALDGLRQLRASVDAAGLTRGSVQAQYTDVISSLLNLGSGLTTEPGAQALAREIRSLDLISQAAEYTSQSRAELNAVFTSNTFLVGQFPEFAGAVARQEQTVEEFLSAASASQQAFYADRVKGAAVTRTKALENRAGELAGASRLGLKADEWYRSSSQKLQLMQEVEAHVLDALVSRSQDLQSRQQRAALFAAVQVLVMLALAAGSSITVVRSLTMPLQRLRLSAMEIADRRLPEAVKRLRSAQVDDLSDLKAVPIDASSPDEIGEVARAVDALQQASLGLAKDQAALRRSVNAMFVNLSLRSQQLGSRLLRLVDGLEQKEVNPDQLESLFAIDHLVTRMLRNSESLLVLAGSQNKRAHSQALPLAQVLMAATSEVDHYTRIIIADFPDVTLTSESVIDVIHLLAELMENATAFSPPESNVIVRWYSSPQPAGLCIEITDHGSGMDAGRLDAANRRLATPPAIDPSSVRTMGLFVVSQLAARHGIGVWLAPSVHGGVTASVMIPVALLAGLPTATLSSGVGDGPAQQPVPLESPDTDAEGGTSAPEAAVGSDDYSTPSAVFGSVEDWRTHRRLVESMTTTDPDGEQ